MNATMAYNLAGRMQELVNPPSLAGIDGACVARMELAAGLAAAARFARAGAEDRELDFQCAARVKG